MRISSTFIYEFLSWEWKYNISLVIISSPRSLQLGRKSGLFMGSVKRRIANISFLAKLSVTFIRYLALIKLMQKIKAKLISSVNIMIIYICSAHKLCPHLTRAFRKSKHSTWFMNTVWHVLSINEIHNIYFNNKFRINYYTPNCF